MRLVRLVTTTGLALGLAASPALALTINYATIAGDSLTAAQLSAFDAAAQAWEAALTNPVTITIDIGFRSLGGSILGGASPVEGHVPYTAGLPSISLLSHLQNDVTDAVQASSVAHLPASVASNTVEGTVANLMAVGYSASSFMVDGQPLGYAGQIEFNTDMTFQYSRNADGTIAAGTYDFLGIAEHEIGHILGFVSDVGSDFTYPSILDLDRYATGSNSLSFAVGAAASLSIDGGATDIAGFSDGTSYQTSHWTNGAGLLMQPAIAPGATQNITATDLVAMNVIGWDLTVPEPASLAVFGFALAGLVAVRRRPARG
jgi:hypothetical protein